MGPETTHPTRPKFHWDLKNPPWTDGRGPQEQYYNAVKLWKSFHDKLPAGNSNKIPPNLQGLILQSQLYERALDLVKKIPNAKIESDTGALEVASCIHKKDVLSIVTDTFHRFLELLRTKQGDSESYKNFETRFDAQVCRLNATCSGSELPSALVSFLLLANSKIDSSQRVSILSAAAPIGTDVTEQDGADVLSLLKYGDVASIVRACDEPRRPFQSSARSTGGMNSFSAYRPNFERVHQVRRKQRLTPEPLADLKTKSTCNKCKMRGHWATDGVCGQNENVSPQSRPTPNAAGATTPPKSTLQFNMASIGSSRTMFASVGPLVDGGAPYCGTGIVELISLYSYLLPSRDGSVQPILSHIRGTPYWKYGSGSHASSRRRILGSVLTSAKSDQGVLLQIRHLVIEGSSQWVIGRNVTRFCNIHHVDRNCLMFRSSVSNEPLSMTLYDIGDHCYLPFSTFECTQSRHVDKCLVSLSCSVQTSDLLWSDRKRIIDKVHRHVCGNSSYEDINFLLSRNEFWNEQCAKYLPHILDTCREFSAFKAPIGTRKVSLSSM